MLGAKAYFYSTLIYLSQWANIFEIEASCCPPKKIVSSRKRWPWGPLGVICPPDHGSDSLSV